MDYPAIQVDAHASLQIAAKKLADDVEKDPTPEQITSWLMQHQSISALITSVQEENHFSA